MTLYGPRLTIALAATALALHVLAPASPASDAPEAPSARPVIACADATFDFGRLDNTNIVTHTFVLTNAGAATLNIGDIRASCGCTVATVSRQQVEPGGTADLTAKLNLAGRRGQQMKSITVASNDPVTPMLQLWMKGFAVVDVGLEPAYVNFGQIATNTERQIDVELLTRDPSVCIKSVSGATDRFQAEILRDAAGVANRLRIRAVAPFPAGFTRTDLVVATTHPKFPELRLPVSALVPEPVYVIPKYVLIRGAANAQPSRRAFLVRPGAAAAFNLLGVDVPDERIQVQTETLGPSNYRVTLTNIPMDPALSGKQVVVRTDLAGFERIPVDMRVTLVPAGQN